MNDMGVSQVRDFVRSALYDPNHGYFSKRAGPVGVLDASIRFNQLEGGLLCPAHFISPFLALLLYEEVWCVFRHYRDELLLFFRSLVGLAFQRRAWMRVAFGTWCLFSKCQTTLLVV